MKTEFCILRVKPLKTIAAIVGSGRHTWREISTPNSDPVMRPRNVNLRVPGCAEALVAAAEARLALATDRATSKTLMLEYLVTASPGSWQRHGGRLPDDSKYFDDALAFLEARHGKENVVAGCIHLDERTPHLVIYVVPLVTVAAHTRQRRVIAGPRGMDGKIPYAMRTFDLPQVVRLSASHFIGGGRKLSALQTEFAQVVGAPHGLKRGIEGSRARHQTVQAFYRLITSAPTPLAPLAVVPPKPEEPQRPGGLGAWLGMGKAHASWLATHSKWRKNMEVRARAQKLHDAQLEQRSDLASSLTVENASLRAQVELLTRKVEHLAHANGAAQHAGEALRQALAQAEEVAGLFTPDEIAQARMRRERHELRLAAEAEAAQNTERMRAAIRIEVANRMAALPELKRRGGLDGLFGHHSEVAHMKHGSDMTTAQWQEVELSTAVAARTAGHDAQAIVEALLLRSPRLADPTLHGDARAQIARSIQASTAPEAALPANDPVVEGGHNFLREEILGGTDIGTSR